jgi:hypothetical protein
MVYVNRDGVRRTLIVDDERPGFVVNTEQNLDEVLAGIARDREIMRQNGDGRLEARLPVPIAERFMLPGGGWDDERLARFLVSSEARPWRIWKGG